jgi:hypothetical protein
MRTIRALLAAILLASCPWHHLGAQVPGQSLPTPPVPSKILPANYDDERPRGYIGLLGVVQSKSAEVPADLCIARYLKIEAVKFSGPDSIKVVAPNGQVFKWVLTPERRLYAIPILHLDVDLYRKRGDETGNSTDNHLLKKKVPDVIKHVIATGGNPVLSAGEAQLQGAKLVVDNHSGHYHPTPESFKTWAFCEFVNAGFKPENIEFHDEREKEVRKYFKGEE